MWKHGRIGWVTMMAMSGIAMAASAQDGPASRAAGIASEPPGLTADSSIDDILDALHRVGENLQSLEATVMLTEIDNATGSPTARPGKVVLAREGDAVSFRATFAGVLVERDGREGLRPEKIEYVLRDGELTDRNYQTRTQVIRKLPASEGKRDLLKLGEGPFPLPIGQSREEVRRQFEVTEVDPSDDAQNEMGIEAAEGTRRLRLTSREGSHLSEDFRWLEIDVNLATGMPAKVIALNATGSTAQVTDLKDIRLNVEVPAKAFDLEAIDRDKWNVIYEDLSKPQPAKS